MRLRDVLGTTFQKGFLIENVEKEGKEQFVQYPL